MFNLYSNKEFLYIKQPGSDGRAEISRVCIPLGLLNAFFSRKAGAIKRNKYLGYVYLVRFVCLGEVKFFFQN